MRFALAIWLALVSSLAFGQVNRDAPIVLNNPPVASGGGAPTDAPYYVTTANGSLSNEVVVPAAGQTFLAQTTQSLMLTTGLGLSANGQSLVTAANYAAMLTLLGAQAADADLTTWAGVTPGTGVATALAVNVGSAGAPVINGGALGTPSSGTGTNLTGIPPAGVTGTAAILGANNFTGAQSVAGSGGVVLTSAATTGEEFYNTADQVTNYEKFYEKWNSNTFEAGALFGGSGTGRSLKIGVAASAGGAISRNLTIGMSAPFFNFAGGTSSAGSQTTFTGTSSASSGNQNQFALTPTFTQTSTAGYTVLLINPTESTTGSGAKLLIDAQVGGVSKFSVDNTGKITSAASAYFRASASANQTGIVDVTNTMVVFNTEEVDVGGFYTPANNEWCPPAGGVQISVNLNSFAATFVAGDPIFATVYKGTTGAETDAAIYSFTSYAVTTAKAPGLSFTFTDTNPASGCYRIYVNSNTTANGTTTLGLASSWSGRAF